MDSGYGSHSGSGHTSGHQTQGSSVFVGGLAFAATEEDLRQALSSAGRIVGCRIVTDRDTGRSKGFGFVDFENDRDRDNALRNFNGIEVCGRPIRLDAGSKGKGGGGKGYGGRGNDYNRGGESGRGHETRQGGYNPQPQQQSYSSGGYSRYPESQPQYTQQGTTSGYQAASSYRRDQDQQGGYRSGAPSSSGYQSGGFRQDYSGHHNQEQSRTQGYGNPEDRRDRYNQNRPAGGYGSSSTRPHDDWRRDQGRGRDRSRSRERSLSVSSSTRERRQREIQSRKEKFAAQNSAGWDRAPNRDEIAQQEAERAAVRAAEATGKDITTIRADLLKQAQWQQHSTGFQ